MTRLSECLVASATPGAHHAKHNHAIVGRATRATGRKQGISVRHLTRHHATAWAAQGADAETLLKGFSGTLQVDGSAGYNRLLKRPGDGIQLACCWAHTRRKLHEVSQTGTTPTADEGLKQIAALYRIEKDIRGQNPKARRATRQERSKPVIDAFEVWLTANRSRVSAKSPIGEALNYIAKYWGGLILFHEDGRIKLVSNAEERMLRTISYLYDFGDSWDHKITVGKFSEPVPGELCPRLKDVGGFPGYEEFLEAMADPKPDLKRWYSGDFTPNTPDSNELRLKALKRAKRRKPKRNASTDQRGDSAPLTTKPVRKAAEPMRGSNSPR